MNKSILITGIAGSGKSAVRDELKKQGHSAFDIELIEGLFEHVHKETGKVAKEWDTRNLENSKKHNWVCNINKLKKILVKNKNDIAFYCGSATNIDEIMPLFDKIFILKADPEILRVRLTNRTSNDFARTKEVQDWVMSYKDWWEIHVSERGGEIVDANQNIEKVVNTILKRI